MNLDPLVYAGAFALYRSENAHRVKEFEKQANAREATEHDFEMYKSKYVRKFEDIRAALEAEGLTISQRN